MLGSSDRRTTHRAIGALVAALVVASCGSGGTDRASEPQGDAVVTSQIQRATTTTPTTAPRPPALLASTVDGNQVDVSALVGQDALLWFWAPW